MAGIPHDHYEPKSGFEKWLHERLPVVSLVYDTLMIPTPKNLNWMWIWGIVLAFCLVMQIATGIILVLVPCLYLILEDITTCFGSNKASA